jgi:hypothetical protein
MDNNTQGNSTTSQNTNQDTTPRDWREERWKWREDGRRIRHEMREARHRWPFHGIFCGLTLVLLGVIFLLSQTGVLSGETWWQWMLIGFGGISIIDGIARYFSNGYRWGIFGKIVGGIVLILIGTFFLVGISEWWPIILIVAGVLFISRVFWRRVNVLP